MISKHTLTVMAKSAVLVLATVGLFDYALVNWIDSVAKKSVASEYGITSNVDIDKIDTSSITKMDIVSNNTYDENANYDTEYYDILDSNSEYYFLTLSKEPKSQEIVADRYTGIEYILTYENGITYSKQERLDQNGNRIIFNPNKLKPKSEE